MAKFNEVVDTISKLLLPIVVASIGLIYNYVQDKNHQAQLALNRTTALLKQLASTNPAERKGAVIVMNYLVQQGEIPPDLATSPLLVAAQDSDTQVADLARAAFARSAQENQEFKSTLEEAAKTDSSIKEILDGAFIENPEDFVTCVGVDSLLPVGTGNKFFTNKVYVWARIQAPRKREKLRLEWLDLTSEKIVHKSYWDITKNIGRGYRAWSYKTLSNGNYEVRLFNHLNDEIARRVFTISDTTSQSKEVLTEKN